MAKRLIFLMYKPSAPNEPPQMFVQEFPNNAAGEQAYVDIQSNLNANGVNYQPLKYDL